MAQGICPRCDQPSVAPHAPFCSRGCKDRDLLAWIEGDYRVAGAEDDAGALDTDS